MKTAAILFVMASTTLLFWWGVWHWFEWVGVYIALAWTAIMIIIYKIKAKRNVAINIFNESRFTSKLLV